MRVQVFLDPIAKGGYRATAGSPFPFTAEGETPYEALEKLKQLIRERLEAGAAVVPIDIPAQEHPILQCAGVFRADDPLVQEWLKIIEEQRRQVDADPDYL
jgi:hypothetical protein